MRQMVSPLPFRLFLAGILMGTTLLLGCSRTVERVSPIGERFPDVQAERLTGEPLQIPSELEGEPSLLLVGYVQDAQFDIDRWLLGLLQAETPVNVVEIPTIRGWAPRIFSGAIDSGMRRGIPQEDWRSVATVYGDASSIIDFLGNDEPLSSRVVLLDADGVVVWMHDDGYSASRLMELDTLVRSLADSDDEGTDVSETNAGIRVSGEEAEPGKERNHSMSEKVERFKTAMNELSAENLHLLDTLYTADIQFADPLHELHGREALHEYFARLYEGVAECRFEFEAEVIEEHSASLVWIMHIRHKRFRPDEVLRLPGMSFLRFDGGKVAYHRDSFDVGAMIYERVPVLGRLIRHIKARI